MITPTATTVSSPLDQWHLREFDEAVVVVNPGTYDGMPTLHRCGVHEDGRCKGCKSRPLATNMHLPSKADLGFDLVERLWQAEMVLWKAGFREVYFCEHCMCEQIAAR